MFKLSSCAGHATSSKGCGKYFGRIEGWCQVDEWKNGMFLFLILVSFARL